MSASKNSLADLAVQKVELYAFGENDRAVVVLGTGDTRQVFLFIGPSDAGGFVAYCMNEIHESALDRFIDGLSKVWKAGSALVQTKSVTAETGGIECGLELNGRLCLEIVGQGTKRFEEPISAIYLFQSSK